MVNQGSFHDAKEAKDSEYFDLRSEGVRRGLVHWNSHLLCMESPVNPESHRPYFFRKPWRYTGIERHNGRSLGNYRTPTIFSPPDDFDPLREAFIRRYSRFGHGSSGVIPLLPRPKAVEAQAG